jgi:threonine/homoserine/homoserine lactone efflux protein
MTMPESDQAFCLIALVICLGACFVWAFCESEAWRRRRLQREELLRDAMRSVATVMKGSK